MASLAGRTCLITGASSGLGAHFARIAAQAGAQVIVAARRLERVESLAGEIRADGGQAIAAQMDVGDEQSVIAAYDTAEAAFGLVDTIIANAGVSAPGRSTEVSVAALQGETLYCASKAAVAHMGRNLAREWVRMGVNVNVLQPGYIDTDLAGDWFSSAGGKAQIAGFQRRRLQPIGSLDAPMLYLCSDESAQTTGAVFTIDDGQSL